MMQFRLLSSARRVVSIFAIVGFVVALVGVRPAHAAPYFDTVRITIERVDALDCFDPTLGVTCGSGADFYPIVNIDGQEFGNDGMQIGDQDHIAPNWQFSKSIDLSRGRIPLSIAIFDSDGAFRFGDDQAHLVPGGMNVDLAVNLAPCGVTGSVTAQCNTAGSLTSTSSQTTQGDSGQRARIQFKVEVLDTDTDGDGLLDGWETRGLDVNGDGIVDVNLPAMGADPRRKDLFLEMDCMVAADHNHCPIQGAISDVVQSFANAPVANPDGKTGIQLHVDTGPLYGAGVVTPVPGNGGVAGSYGDMGGGDTQIPEAGNTIVDWDGATGNPATSFYTLKQMDPNRAYAFRYVIFVHQVNARAASNDCTSGWGEGIPGNDFMVSLGGTNANGNACWQTDANGFSVGNRAMQAGTLMHEFGHTLGLQHGGADGTNGKPNFLSLMNYGFQACSVPTSPTQPTLLPGGCDYSRKVLPSLEERLNPPTQLGLDECAGFDGGAYGFGGVDWNGSGGALTGASCAAPNTANVSADVNGDAGCVGPGPNGVLDTAKAGDDVVVGTEVADGPDRTCQTAASGDDTQDNAVGFVEPSPLNGYDDWNNIVYQFQTRANFANGVASPDHHDATPEMIEAARQAFSKTLAPDLSTNKTGPADAQPGDTVTYTVGVTNQGRGPAQSVSLSDTKPDGAVASFNVGFLAVGSGTTQTVPFAIACTTTDGTVLVDTARASGTDIIGNPESDTANNTKTLSTTVHTPVLTLAKTATTSVNAGEAITYTITYRNTGSGGATSVHVTDLLPADVYYSTALDQGTGPKPTSVTRNADGTTTLAWDVGSVAGGSQGSIQYTARPSLLFLGGSSVTNGATLSFTNANGCTYAPVTTSAPTGITVVPPTRNPLSQGYWKTHPAEWTSEILARIQATDRRFDGADGSSPNGVLSPSEVAAVFNAGGTSPNVLSFQLLGVYFNLATRRINAGTAIGSKTDKALGLSNVRDAARYAMATLALPLTGNTTRYTQAISVLDEINLNKSEVY